MKRNKDFNNAEPEPATNSSLRINVEKQRVTDVKARPYEPSVCDAAQEELRSCDEKYRSFYEKAVEGFAQFRGNKLLGVNPALARMHGFDTPEQMVRTMGDAGNRLWANRDEQEKYKQLLRENGYVQGFEAEVYRKDGSTMSVSLSTRAVRDDGGRFLRYDCTVIDITRRRRAEEALRESEEKFRLLFEKSADPIILVHNGRYIDCNEAAVRLMKCSSKNDLIGLHPRDTSPERQPDGRLSSEKAKEHFAITLRDGVNRFEWVRRNFKGEEFWVDASQTVIPFQGKQILFMVWRDITERKAAEEALRNNQIRLSEVMDLAHIVYWEVDPATDRFLLNDAFYALYGTTAEREGGYWMSTLEYAERFVHPDDLPLYYQTREKVISAQSEFFHGDEHRIVRRDGEVRYVLVRIYKTSDATGNRVKCYGANQDITEQKKAHEELQEAYRRLQEVQNQLVRSERLAVTGQLARGVAHEIKNPLAIILQGVEYLEWSITSEHEREALKMIKDASWRADKTIRNLLLFAEQSASRPETSNVVPVIDEALDLLEPQMKHAAIKVVTQYSEDLPPVKIDRGQIKQAFANIILNAIDAMADSGGTVTITTEENSAERDYVRVIIADTGTGIPEGYLDRIFDPFITTKRKQKNIGLGLTTTHYIIQSNNGKIHVESGKNKGTRMIVDLPAVNQDKAGV